MLSKNNINNINISLRIKQKNNKMTDNFNIVLLENIMNSDYYNDLWHEVEWLDIMNKDNPIPRLFALQGNIINGSIPLYRFPIDIYPRVEQFTPTVDKIRLELERRLNTEFNHCIIQLYRDGSDNISSHSDKTLDIKPNSLIINYSAGAMRVMKFKKKESENSKGIRNIALPNDSALVMDLITNKYYKHSIRKDSSIKDQRISITFRNIGTFYDPKIKTISGQGAAKDNGMTQQEVFYSWAKENKSSSESWDELYSRGYNYVFQCLD